MIVLSVVAMAVLLAASITLIALAMRCFVRDIARSPFSTNVNSVAVSGRSQRELQAWRANQAEGPENLIDPYNTNVAEFIGGPLNGQIYAMQEPFPHWNVPVAPDLDPLSPVEDSPPMPVAVDVYIYERQSFFSSTGNAVYLCQD